MAEAWDVVVGGYLSRQERSARFGGSTMGGIQPSAKSPNVFVYSDPAEGHRNGYIFDGWTNDRSVFLYTGEGRTGDQRMAAGNLAIRQHKQQGRALRVFVADGRVAGGSAKQQQYIGEFEVDDELPYVRERAPDVDGVERSVIVFRLRPRGSTLTRDADVSGTGDVAAAVEAEAVPLEAANKAEFRRAGQREMVVKRRELELVERYRASLNLPETDLYRWRVRPAGTLLTLFTDLYHRSANELYEAKASSTREDMRMALGQLLDYRRWLAPAPDKTTVLVPSRPADDLIALFHAFGIGVVYETATSSFRRSDPPAVS